MTITYAESLSTFDGLRLHENFAQNAGFSHTTGIVTLEGKGVDFLGLRHGAMRDLIDKLDLTTPNMPKEGFMGFAGKHILSLHFTDTAFGQFLRAVKQDGMPHFIVQVSDKNKFWHQVAQHWVNHQNVQELAGGPQIMVRRSNDGRSVDYMFPANRHMQLFMKKARGNGFHQDAILLERGEIRRGGLPAAGPADPALQTQVIH